MGVEQDQNVVINALSLTVFEILSFYEFFKMLPGYCTTRPQINWASNWVPNNIQNILSLAVFEVIQFCIL